MSKQKIADKKVNYKLYDVIRTPVITEKSQLQLVDNKLVLEVSPESDKSSIKDAVLALFDVEILKINVITVKGKVKRFRGTTGKQKNRKKAIITVKSVENIDLSSGFRFK